MRAYCTSLLTRRLTGDGTPLPAGAQPTHTLLLSSLSFVSALEAFSGSQVSCRWRKLGVADLILSLAACHVGVRTRDSFTPACVEWSTVLVGVLEEAETCEVDT